MQTNNCCTFAKIIDGKINTHGEKCGLYFKTLQELIYHIEEDHIPLIESIKAAERKQIIEQFGKDQEQYEKAYAAFLSQPVPLSLICRLKPLPKGYKIQPLAPPKPRTMKFCHYKLKQQPISQQQPYSDLTAPSFTDFNQNLGISELDTNRQQQILSSYKSISDNQSRLRQTSTSSEGAATPELSSAQEQQTLSLGQEERKFYCQIENCGKTYKNQHGLRTHLRNAHNIDSSLQIIATKLSASEESILSRQLPGKQSPFLSVNAEQISSKTQDSPARNILSTSFRNNETKFLCQHCTKGYKTISNLNKHLLDSHGIVLSSPALTTHATRYASSSPLINTQQIYSSQQSPRRSTSNTINIIPVTKAQSVAQSQNSFVAPTLTARHYQANVPTHQIARPTAPIPPSTPPLVNTNNNPIPQSIEYSPQTQQHLQSTTLIQSQQDMQYPQRIMNTAIVVDQHHEQGQNAQIGQQQQHYYLTTHTSDGSLIDQQTPILQTQQQPSSQKFRYTYQQQQPQQAFVQRQQMEQQIYSSGLSYSSYPVSNLNNQQQQAHSGTTIFVSQQGNVGASPMHHHYAIQQPLELDQQHDNYSRTYYRHQNHYMVEPIQSTSNYAQQPVQLQPPNNRITSTTSTSRLSASTNSSQYIQQQGMQQTQQFTTAYPQHRGGTNIYQETVSQQQPYMTTLRTASVQPTHRIYHQQQFYTQQPRSHVAHTSSQRQSPATVAAVLAADLPQQGSNTPNPYGSQSFGGLLQ